MRSENGMKACLRFALAAIGCAVLFSARAEAMSELMGDMTAVEEDEKAPEATPAPADPASSEAAQSEAPPTDATPPGAEPTETQRPKRRRLTPMAVRSPEAIQAPDPVAPSEVELAFEPPPDAIEMGSRRQLRFGARVSHVAFTGMENSSAPAATCGGAFFCGPPGLFGRESLSFEAGVDVGKVGAEDTTPESSLYLFQFSLLYSMHSKYGMVGTRAVSTLTSDGLGTTTGEVAAALDLGVGIGDATSVYDVRLVYSALVGSKNATGMVGVSAGMRF